MFRRVDFAVFSTRVSFSLEATSAGWLADRKFIKVHGRPDAHVCLSNLILERAHSVLPHLGYIVSPANLHAARFHRTLDACVECPRPVRSLLALWRANPFLHLSSAHDTSKVTGFFSITYRQVSYDTNESILQGIVH